MSYENYTLLSDEKYLVRHLKLDYTKYSKLIECLTTLGNFDTNIKLFVKEDYEKTKLIYTIDKNNKLFYFYNNNTRDYRQRHQLYMQDNDIVIKKYYYLNDIKLIGMGYLKNIGLLWISSDNTINLELKNKYSYSLESDEKITDEEINKLINLFNNKEFINFNDFIGITKSAIDFSLYKKIILTECFDNAILNDKVYHYNKVTSHYKNKEKIKALTEKNI